MKIGYGTYGLVLSFEHFDFVQQDICNLGESCTIPDNFISKCLGRINVYNDKETHGNCIIMRYVAFKGEINRVCYTAEDALGWITEEIIEAERNGEIQDFMEQVGLNYDQDLKKLNLNPATFFWIHKADLVAISSITKAVEREKAHKREIKEIIQESPKSNYIKADELQIDVSDIKIWEPPTPYKPHDKYERISENPYKDYGKNIYF